MAALRTEQTSGWGLTLSCRKHRSLLVSGMVKGSRLLLNYGARGHEQLCTNSSFCCYFVLFYFIWINVPTPAHRTLSADFDRKLLSSQYRMPPKLHMCTDVHAHCIRITSKKTQNHKKETVFLLGNPALIISFFLFLPVNVMKTLAHYSITH